MSVMLSVHDLSIKTLAGETIIYPTSFQLHAGEALTIVGETGSGKTLLAQAIANTLPEDLVAEGEIYLHDIAILNLLAEERKALWGETLCILPQEPMRSLDPTMRSAKQVNEGYRLVKKLSACESRKSTKADFQQLSLSHAKKQYPHELSGGMAQRVAFLAARSGGATFTIADEPTKGLDANKRDEISKQLQILIDNNEGVLTITHDIEVAQQLGGRVMIMKNGNVIEQGASDDVLHSPDEPYTKMLINADPKRWLKRGGNANSNKIIVEARAISKSRNNKELFKDLSFVVAAKSIVGVSGDSGCGKSTLGDMLLGFLPSDNGEVIWKNDGRSNNNISAQKIFQDPSDVFSSHVTLKRSFRDVMKKHRVEEAKFDEWLDVLKIDKSLTERYPSQVSGGELQRLAIARVMLTNPAFIFADEPTSRLDMVTQKSIVDALVTVVEHSDTAMLIVSHDKALLEKVCDEIIEIKN